jgi:hypothetical protein
MMRLKLLDTMKSSNGKHRKYICLVPTSFNLTAFIDNNTIDQQQQSNEAAERKYYTQQYIITFDELNVNACPLMINTTLKMIESVQSSLSKVSHLEILKLKEKNLQ